MKMKKMLTLVLMGALAVSASACSNSSNTNEPTSVLKDGTYNGTGSGHNSDVSVAVEVKEGKLTHVEITEHHETVGIGDKAMSTMVAKMNETGSSQVDTVSNATISSLALKNAVKNALKEAGADDAYFENEEVVALDRAELENEYTYDVVIVGAGGAGLSAAIEAAQSGAKVAVIEKTPATGGNTLVSGGGLNAPQTAQQIERGIEDSVEKFYEDTYNSGDQQANPELVHVMAEEALDATNWLINDIGVEFMPDRLQQFGGHSVPRALIPVGNHGDELILKLEAAAEKAGVDMFFSVKGEELVENDGKVTAIKASYGDQEIVFNANKGVILATGGFASNVEMRKKYNANYDERFKTTARDVSSGDGILMAEEIGAQLVDMEFIQVYPTCNPQTGIISYVANARMDGGILVNQEGQRFVNEMGRRDDISNAILDQTGSYAYLVWGQETEEIGHMTEVHSVEFQKWIDSGLLHVADTLEECAEYFDVDPQALVATVEAYNTSVEDGVDEDFNRSGSVRKTATGPFYIQKVVPSSHHTMGGVAINTNAQVLDTEGNVIEGLYAAGEVTGDIHGTNRLGGNAITDCVVFGRIAGRNAAQ